MAKVAALRVTLTATTKAFSRAMRRAQRTVRRFRGVVGSVTKRLVGYGVAIAALAGPAAMGLLIKRQFAWLDLLGKTADILQMNTKNLMALQHTAKIAGVDLGQFYKALETMQARLGEVQLGTGQAKIALEALGLSARALSAMDPADAFAQIADAMLTLENATQKAAVARYIFGRAGVRLLNMMTQGGKAIRESRKEIEALGGAFGRVDIKIVEDANDAIANLKQAIQIAASAVAIQLAPYVTDLARRFVGAAKAGGGMALRVVEGVKAILKYLARVMDNIRYIQIGWKGMSLIVLESESRVLNTLYLGWFGLLDLMNRIPGINIKIGNSLATVIHQINQLAMQTREELVELLEKPLPSTAMARWLAETPTLARQAAERAVAQLQRVPKRLTEAITDITARATLGFRAAGELGIAAGAAMPAFYRSANVEVRVQRDQLTELKSIRGTLQDIASERTGLGG